MLLLGLFIIAVLGVGGWLSCPLSFDVVVGVNLCAWGVRHCVDNTTRRWREA